MTRNFRILIASCAAVMFVAAGCSTSATPADATQTADAKPDPRQGEEVRNICFQSQIRAWRKLDNRSVIVEVGVRDEYKLDLVGSCQPDDAFTQIGLVSRVGTGSCLETGDRLVTDARYNDGDCSIRRIYKWNKDAATAQAAPSAS